MPKPVPRRLSAVKPHEWDRSRNCPAGPCCQRVFVSLVRCETNTSRSPSRSTSLAAAPIPANASPPAAAAPARALPRETCCRAGSSTGGWADHRWPRRDRAIHRRQGPRPRLRVPAALVPKPRLLGHILESRLCSAAVAEQTASGRGKDGGGTVVAAPPGARHGREGSYST